MNTIKNNKESILIIKESKFISYLYQVTNKEEIDNILKELKTKYKDATHICYAYRLINLEKACDDKEPSGTAGLPILEILKKNEIINTLAVTIRYYGGIKLGAGNLLRAYKNSINNLLDKENIIPYYKYEKIKITTPFSNEKLLNKLIKNNEIIKKEYTKEITYIVKVKDSEIDDFIKSLGVIKEITITKI